MRSPSDMFGNDFLTLTQHLEAERQKMRALIDGSAAEFAAKVLMGSSSAAFSATLEQAEAERHKLRAAVDGSAAEFAARAVMGSSSTALSAALEQVEAERQKLRTLVDGSAAGIAARALSATSLVELARSRESLTYASSIRLDLVTVLQRSSSFLDFAHDAVHHLEGRADVEVVISAPARETVTYPPRTRNTPRAVPTPLYVWAGSPTATLAVVFTDIIGSTALGLLVGNEEMGRVRRAHFRCGESYAKRFHGRVIKTSGDELMVAFRSAPDAVDFVRAIQEDPGDARISLRAAIHVGLVDVEDNDIFGSAVDFTARLLTAAAGAELILSADA